MVCENCGRESAEAQFCTFCGTRQGASTRAVGGRRGERFAAHPNEGVLQPGVVTTLFPHLAHGNVNEYRWALLIGGAILVVLYLLGLIAAAVLTGAILVPVVYILYLYEARVYRDAPVQVVGLTLGGGALVGVVITLIGDAIAGIGPLIRSTRGGLEIDVSGVAIFLIALPIVTEIVKPLPAFLLRRWASFPETIDGLVFGIAAGLGFAAAETILHFASVITSGEIQSTPGDWIYPLITLAILMPLLHGSATGLITGALWQRPPGALRQLALGAIGVAILGHIAFVLGTEVLQEVSPSPLVPLAWQIGIVGGLLIAVRIVLHRALLDEAQDLGLTQVVCPNCSSHVTAASFCPVCGAAMRAAPRASSAAKNDRAARTEGG